MPRWTGCHTGTVSVKGHSKQEILKQLSSGNGFARLKVNICYFSIIVFAYR